MRRILKLAEDKRTPSLNMILGTVCAFVSGSINAGGFIILGQYTSHITGIVATAADAIALSQFDLFQKSLFFISCFFLGAVFSTLLIQFAQRLKLHSRFALSFLAGGILLVLLGAWVYGTDISPRDTYILELGFFFSMGIQNATVTRLSNYDIRATHMTGIVTDIGIEFGKLLFHREMMNLRKFKLLLLIITSFFIGGICGAYSFKSSFGTASLFWYGGIMIILAFSPIYRDIQVRLRYLNKRRKQG